MSLFEKFTKKKPSDAPAIETISLHETNIDITSKGAIAEDESEGYYFQNPIELAIYGKFHGKDKTVCWLTGNDYIFLMCLVCLSKHINTEYTQQQISQ